MTSLTNYDKAEAEGLAGKARDKEDDDGFLKLMRERASRGVEYERNNTREAYQDLEFRAGIGHWDEKIKKDRENADRPCLVVNRCPQFINQVTGDIRQMNPTFKVVGIQDNDKDKAEAVNQILRHITYNSVASDAFYYAADSQVTAGIGHWRVTTDYADDDTDLQEIRIERVDDGVGVIWDPDATRPDRSDAQWCFVPVDMTLAVFKEKYPDASTSGFDDIHQYRAHSMHGTDSWWSENDNIRVCEYWVKKKTKKDIIRADDSVIQRDATTICKYVVTSTEILEDAIEWGVSKGKKNAKHIPIVPIIGEEVRVGTKTYRHGKIRFIKDAQRRLNYFTSSHVEVVALQPKVPFIAAKGQLDDHLEMWSGANTDNLPALIYTPVSGASAPQRSQPPVSSQGIGEGINLAVEDMKAITGIYDSALGNRSNETSGIAIQARDRQSDTGTYVYIENFKRALEHTGRIILEMIPHIYDTERVLQVIGEDGAVNEVDLNKALLLGGQDFIQNDMSNLSYDLRVETGASYTTKRMEAKDGMMSFLQSNPAVSPMIADLVAKSQDWPLSDKIAERLKTMLPPAILAAEQEEEGAQPKQPPMPSPEEQAAMQMEMESKQADMAMKQADVNIKNAQAQKAQADAMKADLELKKAEAEMAGMMQPIQTVDPRVDMLAQNVNTLEQALSQIIAMLEQPQEPQMAFEPQEQMIMQDLEQGQFVQPSPYDEFAGANA